MSELDFEFDYEPEEEAETKIENKPVKQKQTIKKNSNVTPINDNVRPKQSAATKTSFSAEEVHMQIRLALAEAKTEFLVEYIAEAKLLEYQVRELLNPFIVNAPLEKPIKRIYRLLNNHTKIKK